jgi:RHS repeat-associated protein
MPATPTYSPLISQNSAECLWTNTCRYAESFRIEGNLSDATHPTPNSQLLTPNWSFTFSAKERDPETGYSYFGSRYYSSDLSIWLSVDPMAHKYPSLSPYVYCANNPVKLVDPNGEEVWIIGNEDNVNTVISSLNSYFENITVKCDKYGQLTIESGNPLTDDEKAFAEALADTKIQVNLQLGYSQKTGFKTPAGEDVESEGAGAFLGNDILYYDGRQEKDNIRKVRTLQYLSTDAMKRLYKEKDWGMLINHEITESYRGGIISSETNIPGRDKNGVINSLIKNKAHLEATPQPYTIGASWLHH